MKSEDLTHSLVAMGTSVHSVMNLDKIVCITRSAHRLFRVTALVLRQTHKEYIPSIVSSEAQISTEEIARAIVDKPTNSIPCIERAVCFEKSVCNGGVEVEWRNIFP